MLTDVPSPTSRHLQTLNYTTTQVREHCRRLLASHGAAGALVPLRLLFVRWAAHVGFGLRNPDEAKWLEMARPWT